MPWLWHIALCIALMRGDVQAAWEANQFAFLAVPLLIILAARQTARWVSTGKRTETKGEHWLTIVLAVSAVCWSILRNLFFT